MDDLSQAAEEHFERGNQFDEAGNREGAIAEWQQAVDLNPRHAAAHYNLGIAYAEERRYPLAVAELQASIRCDPFDLDARLELAGIYLEQDQFDDAVSQLRQALNISPGSGEAAHLLARAYLEREMWDEASGALEAGAFLEEDADLWCQLGHGYLQNGQREEAILAFRRALACQPSHRDAEDALRRLDAAPDDPPGPDETDDLARE